MEFRQRRSSRHIATRHTRARTRDRARPFIYIYVRCTPTPARPVQSPKGSISYGITARTRHPELRENFRSQLRTAVRWRKYVTYTRGTPYRYKYIRTHILSHSPQIVHSVSDFRDRYVSGPFDDRRTSINVRPTTALITRHVVAEGFRQLSSRDFCPSFTYTGDSVTCVAQKRDRLKRISFYENLSRSQRIGHFGPAFYIAPTISGRSGAPIFAHRVHVIRGDDKPCSVWIRRFLIRERIRSRLNELFPLTGGTLIARTQPTHPCVRLGTDKQKRSKTVQNWLRNTATIVPRTSSTTSTDVRRRKTDRRYSRDTVYGLRSKTTKSNLPADYIRPSSCNGGVVVAIRPEAVARGRLFLYECRKKKRKKRSDETFSNR